MVLGSCKLVKKKMNVASLVNAAQNGDGPAIFKKCKGTAD
jgi:hypothetical protein